MAVYPTKTNPAVKAASAVPVAAPVSAPVEVTPEVTAAPGADVAAAATAAFNAARVARFATTISDAPISNGPTTGKLNAKTLAEHAAGKAALSQYAPAEE